MHVDRWASVARDDRIRYPGLQIVAPDEGSGPVIFGSG